MFCENFNFDKARPYNCKNLYGDSRKIKSQAFLAKKRFESLGVASA